MQMYKALFVFALVATVMVIPGTEAFFGLGLGGLGFGMPFGLGFGGLGMGMGMGMPFGGMGMMGMGMPFGGMGMMGMPFFGKKKK